MKGKGLTPGHLVVCVVVAVLMGCWVGSDGTTEPKCSTSVTGTRECPVQGPAEQK